MKRDLSGLDAKGLQTLLEREFEKPTGTEGADLVARVREAGNFVTADPPKSVLRRILRF